MYSVRIRNTEKRTVPMMNPATFAAVRVCRRTKIESGTSGCRCRDSQSANATSSAPDATNVPIVRDEPGDADGHVDEEDPLPRQELGDDPARRTPAAAPKPPTAPQAPSAMLRS